MTLALTFREMVPQTLPALIAVTVGLLCLCLATFWAGRGLWRCIRGRFYRRQNQRISKSWQDAARRHELQNFDYRTAKEHEEDHRRF